MAFKTNNVDNDIMKIYIDGSKSDESTSTGAAVYIEHSNDMIKISMPKECSISAAEACAIKEALEGMSNQRMTKDTIVLTDVLSIVQTLENNNIDAYQNNYITGIRDIHYYLSKSEYRKSKNVVIGWIPVHRGTKGNEKMDREAKDAAEKGNEKIYKVPFTDLEKIYSNRK